MSIFNVLPHIHTNGSSPIHALLVLTIKHTDKNDGKISLGLICASPLFDQCLGPLLRNQITNYLELKHPFHQFVQTLKRRPI